MKIALIGAGNLATNLGRALVVAGNPVCQVYSRTQEHAETLGIRLGCGGVSDLGEVVTDADLYIVALKDSVLADLLPRLVSGRERALWVHTAGSVPMSVWSDLGLTRYGVLYPMQTFSKAREVSFEEIPFFIEASGVGEQALLESLASSMSRRVCVADSGQRRALHLAAVFVCNFANALYTAGADLLAEQGLSFDVMLPLIDETTRKIHHLPPREAQTGPAVRNDRNVIDKHLALLDDHPDYRRLYDLMSEIIHRQAQEGNSSPTSSSFNP